MKNKNLINIHLLHEVLYLYLYFGFCHFLIISFFTTPYILQSGNFGDFKNKLSLTLNHPFSLLFFWATPLLLLLILLFKLIINLLANKHINKTDNTKNISNKSVSLNSLSIYIRWIFPIPFVSYLSLYLLNLLVQINNVLIKLGSVSTDQFSNIYLSTYKLFESLPGALIVGLGINVVIFIPLILLIYIIKSILLKRYIKKK